ncbi:MAG: hypothetical protein GF308_08315 [Candidatus Heimdallarchaeota archaeon]|nr:hypothetical protein [Candidatus Heimdallarchaeota archaeon]
MIKSYLTIIIIACASLNNFFIAKNYLSVSQTTNEQKNWTVMLYYCADTRTHGVGPYPNNSGAYNWLNSIMFDCISFLPGLITGGSLDDINIIVLYDEPYSASYPNGHAKILKIGYSNPPLELEDWGAENLGLYVTLSNFINYCKNHFPANHYALSLTDHGRAYSGYCYDYHGQHPYWNYTLGDCLTVRELRTALTYAGRVNVLFLDTCLGASFEVAWELTDFVDYLVAGESTQRKTALVHGVDVVRRLSQNTAMSPFELAQIGVTTAQSVILNPPSIPNDQFYDWPTVSLIAPYRFNLTPVAASFKDLFSGFTDELIVELDNNFTRARELFGQIRGELSGNGFTSSSMLIDLYEFLEAIEAHSANFTNPQVVTKAGSVKNYLEVSPTSLLHDFYIRPDLTSNLANLHGFSICFPDSRDLYQGYLWPNMYEDIAIAQDTQWDDFIFRLFPPEADPFLWPIPEFWEVNLYPIDPLVSCHVFLEHEELIRHVGLATGDFGLSEVELGIEGAGYLADLVGGRAMIRIPHNSLSLMKTNNEIAQKFTIVINGSHAGTVNHPVNLSVRHVVDNSIVWEQSQVKSLESGQDLACEVSTTEEMSELKPVGEPSTTTPPTTTPITTTSPTNSTNLDPLISDFFGPSFIVFSTTGIFSLLIIIILYNKKKK